MQPAIADITRPAALADHVTITPSVLYVGTPVALLATMNADGTSNISPMSSVWALFDRLVLGLTATSKGRENAVRERQLTINFPTPDLWSKVEALARTTGRNPVPGHKARIGYEFEPGKFARAGFTPLASEAVRPPRIAECPIQFEAEVMDVHDPAGDWPAERAEAYQIIETRVLRVHAHRNLVIPGTSHIDTRRWSPLLYVFRHYFGTGPDLGRTFKAEY
ncbi:MAG: flavin reductase family protein [Acetobacteraceae bacterium]